MGQRTAYYSACIEQTYISDMMWILIFAVYIMITLWIHESTSRRSPSLPLPLPSVVRVSCGFGQPSTTEQIEPKRNPSSQCITHCHKHLVYIKINIF